MSMSFTSAETTALLFESPRLLTVEEYHRMVAAGVPAESTSEDRHPETAILVIEVAGDSRRRDRRVKAAVYARAGIPEYWIVNLEARVVEILSDPEAGTGMYRRTRTCATSDTLTSEALPQLSFLVAELFG